MSLDFILTLLYYVLTPLTVLLIVAYAIYKRGE